MAKEKQAASFTALVCFAWRSSAGETESDGGVLRLAAGQSFCCRAARPSCSQLQPRVQGSDHRAS